MLYCLKCGCAYDNKKCISMHKFPHHKPPICALWERYVDPTGNFKAGKNSRLCTREFDEKFQEKRMNKKGLITVYLRSSAIPKGMDKSMIPVQTTARLVTSLQPYAMVVKPIEDDDDEDTAADKDSTEKESASTETDEASAEKAAAAKENSEEAVASTSSKESEAEEGEASGAAEEPTGEAVASEKPKKEKKVMLLGFLSRPQTQVAQCVVPTPVNPLPPPNRVWTETDWSKEKKSQFWKSLDLERYPIEDRVRMLFHMLTEAEYKMESLRSSLMTFLNEDQVLAAMSTSRHGGKWSAETVKKCSDLLARVGNSTYEHLLNTCKWPMPSLRILQARKKLERTNLGTALEMTSEPMPETVETDKTKKTQKVLGKRGRSPKTAKKGPVPKKKKTETGEVKRKKKIQLVHSPRQRKSPKKAPKEKEIQVIEVHIDSESDTAAASYLLEEYLQYAD